MTTEGDIRVQVNEHELLIHRVLGFLGEEYPSLKRKLIPREELRELGDFLERRGIIKVITTGVYDVIHIGHGRYLELARSLGGEGGVLIVGLNSDTSVMELKGPDRPILPEQARAEMLSFLQCVNYITIYPEPDGAEIIRLLKPNYYLCVEGSWTGDLASKAEVIAMAEIGGEVFYAPRQDPSLSTTVIIRRIADKEGLRRFHELMADHGT